jgi:uncharacterized protein DUF4412
MKLAAFSFTCSICLIFSARADLTLVQKVDGVGQGGDMTIKIKGDKARIDASAKLTTIIDSKTGEIVNLMNDRKTVMRISAEKMKAAAEMIGKFNPKKETAAKGKLTATGKKETVAGYETEEYVYETPNFKANYWIAPNYPDGPAILKQLQSLNSDAWQTNNLKLPDYRDFPGLPIKTVVSSGDSAVTTTLVSVKQDPLDDAQFSVPKDFKEIKIPDMQMLPRIEAGAQEKQSAPASPKP